MHRGECCGFVSEKSRGTSAEPTPSHLERHFAVRGQPRLVAQCVQQRVRMRRLRVPRLLERPCQLRPRSLYLPRQRALRRGLTLLRAKVDANRVSSCIRG